MCGQWQRLTVVHFTGYYHRIVADTDYNRIGFFRKLCGTHYTVWYDLLAKQLVIGQSVLPYKRQLSIFIDAQCLSEIGTVQYLISVFLRFHYFLREPAVSAFAVALTGVFRYVLVIIKRTVRCFIVAVFRLFKKRPRIVLFVNRTHRIIIGNAEIFSRQLWFYYYMIAGIIIFCFSVSFFYSVEYCCIIWRITCIPIHKIAITVHTDYSHATFIINRQYVAIA